MSELHAHPHSQGDDSLDVLNRIQRPALLIGVAGAVLLLIGLFVSGPEFFQSYLYGYLFWIGIAAGCFALLMLQHLTGGAWGLVVRRILETGSRMLLPMAILFIPIALGTHSIYPWTHEEEAATLHGLKAWYLQDWFFVARAAGYFVIWVLLALLLTKWSKDQDRTGDPRLVRRMQLVSGPGLVIYALTMTFASVDWVMSLDPHWFSTMFGFLFIVGQILSTMALVIALVVLIGPRSPLRNLLNPGLYNDLGNLLMAFTMLWAYISFSQFLIIWSGNIAEETPYYYIRMHGLWGAVGVILIVFHFFVPFTLLLWRKTKRHPRALAIVAAWIILMRFVDLFWLTRPSFLFHRLFAGVPAPENVPGFSLHWLNLVAPIALGGIFVALFIWQLKRHPILPANDPRLAELEASHHHG